MLEILIIVVIALIVFGPMLLKARKNSDSDSDAGDDDWL